MRCIPCYQRAVDIISKTLLNLTLQMISPSVGWFIMMFMASWEVHHLTRDILSTSSMKLGLLSRDGRQKACLNEPGCISQQILLLSYAKSPTADSSTSSHLDQRRSHGKLSIQKTKRRPIPQMRSNKRFLAPKWSIQWFA